MTAVFIITAVVLIVIGGLLTALDGALHVLSRNDLLDEAEGAKRRRALQSRDRIPTLPLAPRQAAAAQQLRSVAHHHALTFHTGQAPHSRGNCQTSEH